MLARRSLRDQKRPEQKRPMPIPAPTTGGPDAPTKPDFVLYFHPNCPTCRLLLPKLQGQAVPNVYVQNVLLLQNRPPWLNGVPILADTHLGMIYRGTDAMIFLESLAKSKEEEKKKKLLRDSKQKKPPLSPTTPPTPTHPPSAPQTAKSGMDSLFQMDEEPEIPAQNHVGKQQKLSEDKISELIKRREQQMPKSKRIIG